MVIFQIALEYFKWNEIMKKKKNRVISVCEFESEESLKSARSKAYDNVGKRFNLPLKYTYKKDQEYVTEIVGNADIEIQAENEEKVLNLVLLYKLLKKREIILIICPRII